VKCLTARQNSSLKADTYYKLIWPVHTGLSLQPVRTAVEKCTRMYGCTFRHLHVRPIHMGVKNAPILWAVKTACMYGPYVRVVHIGLESDWLD